MPPAPLVGLAARLRQPFLDAGFDTDGVLQALGPDAHAALGRAEPVPVRRACADADELGTLIRLFLLADTCGADAVDAALGAVPLAQAVAAGLLERDGDGVRTRMDLRPVDTGHGTRWVFSDLDGSIRPTVVADDHVLGVGHASLSLVRASVPASGRVLDLGTGCGVQALHALGAGATHVTATDVTDRSLLLTRAGMAINAIAPERVDLRRGPWFEPVAGMRFDHVVANPPFVVGPPTVTHTYRDSGLDLDGASQMVVSSVAEHLVDGGTACLLASWVITGSDWRERVASWIPDHGVDAWVVQRDVADPALYVGTWLRDGGLDPRAGAGAAAAEEWLDHLARAAVEGIGFGFVYLRRTGEPSDVLAEEMSHAVDDPLGPEAAAYLDRVAWLRETDLFAARLGSSDSVALEEISAIAPEGGWEQVVCRLHRTDGPRWAHEVDGWGRALVAGLRRDGLPLADVVALLSAATGVDLDDDAVLALVSGLVRHGLLTPDS
ncbi:methyltransferase [Williamsia sp. CHRR-6]|nr:methyltransferase [Williamsia sp. CHRR-6]